MNANKLRKKALTCHDRRFKGKLKVMPLKSISNQEEYSLAYTPGVAFPYLEIKKNSEKIYRFTSKGNLMAVVSNGSSVLGLGSIGPEAGLPVMEEKAVLLKKFAGINAIGLCIGKTLNAKRKTLVKEFVLPLVLDSRVVPRLAREVVKAAIKSGVTRKKISNYSKYEKDTEKFIEFTNENIQVCLKN